MKKNRPNMAVAVCIAMFSAFGVQADEDLRADTQQTLEQFKTADSTIQKFFTNSAGYAIFPSVGKGGFIVGGARGKGLVYEKDNLIGQATLTQASIGAQVGGQSFAELIFFETPAALEDFKAGKFEMSAEASAVAVRQGASSAVPYKQGIAVFTLPKKGLMVSASVGGQKFKFEPDVPQPTGRSDQK